MTLQQLLITLSLFSSFLCISMNRFPEKEFINFDQITDYYIQDDFKTKWGYSIPHLLIKETINNKSIYKVVSQNYIHQSNHPIEIQDTCNPFVTTIKKEINALQTEKESLKKELDAKQTLMNKLILQTVELKEQLLSIKKTDNKNNSTQSQSITTKKITPQIKTNSQQKKAAPKKKKAFSAAIYKPITPKNNVLQNNCHTVEAQQKMSILRDLMKKYKVKSPAQLKNKLAEECDEDDYPGIWNRVNEHCIWSYSKATNELKIDTNNHESDDTSSGSWDDSSSDPSLD